MPKLESLFNDLDEKKFDHFMDMIIDQIKVGLIPKPKFLLYLGDVVGHIRIGKHFVWENEVAFFKKFTQEFPDIPILYTFGNNDAFSRNYGSFASPDTDGQVKTPLDAAKASGKWRNGFISKGATACQPHASEFPCVLSQNQVDGYYAAYLEPKLKLIDLNTVMLSIKQVRLSSTAVDAQFAWLEQQLQVAEANQESVIIAMHIPIGKNIYDDSFFLKPEANQRLINLIQRYHSIIMGVLAGHTHMDEIKLIRDKAYDPLVGVYLNPALSTAHGNAPAIRSYAYALFNNQWKFVDYTTFYFTKNKADQNQISLQVLYHYHDAYCIAPDQLVNDCLSQVNVLSIAKYYTAGNTTVDSQLNYPENIYIR